ncbi:MAG: hypothetical protein IPM69_18565 [Ignavibacteria bacterium]|nr:hypothetical protein [Ignavibacteria bacterium]
MLKLIGSIALILLVMACGSVKNTKDNSSEDKSSEKITLADSIYRFTVSFISIGSGIDHKAREQFTEFIKKYSEKHNVILGFDKSTWGREGEVDYCMKLLELTAAQEFNFIAETKEILKNSSRVRYRENSICRSSR